MPVYSVNRRRAIILLILTSVLLLTLDLRGNAVVDRMRNVFSHVLSPFVTAGDVIATPIKNVWHGATDYQDLQRENEQLRERIAQQSGAELAARAYVSEHQALLALNGLIANYPRVTARVVGDRTSNFRQTIEIDRGSEDGILVGMAVINSAGLVGKITQVYDNRSVVRLVTDLEYTIECKVSGVVTEQDQIDAAAESSDATTDTDGTSDSTQATTPSGENAADLSTTTTVAPSTTTTTTDPDSTDPDNTDPDGTDPDGADPDSTDPSGIDPDSTDPDGTDTDDADTDGTSTTTTVLVERETGGCEGRGSDALPVMKFVTENPMFGTIDVGDVVTTSGGSKSLAPPDIIIGTVVNKIERASSAGPLLEIELSANLDHLSLVQIIQFRPTSEVPG